MGVEEAIFQIVLFLVRSIRLPLVPLLLLQHRGGLRGHYDPQKRLERQRRHRHRHRQNPGLAAARTWSRGRRRRPEQEV